MKTYTTEELAEVLRLHKMYREGHDDGQRAILHYINLSGADLREADLAQLVAQRLGIELEWWHCDLVPGATWEKGRKQVE